MDRVRLAVAAAAGLAVIAAASVVAAWTLGRQHALTSLSFVDVSASALALAMQDDHFYSDYGDKVLLIRGTISTVQGTSDGSQLTFRTDTTFGLTCTMSGSAANPPPSVGSVIGVIAIGGTALRDPSAVNLGECRPIGMR